MYFFPLLFLAPDEDLQDTEQAPFRLLPRAWGTSIFDLATLATKHRLHLPYQLIDVFLAKCNMEIAVEAADLNAAIDRFSALLFGMYLEDVSPTIAPYIASHSIIDYSCLNDRDDERRREALPETVRNRFKSSDGTIEAWPHHLSLTCQVRKDGLRVTERQFRTAASNATAWLQLEGRHAALRAVREAALAAPLLGSRDQALLHVWCAIEALFPQVTTEVSFRIALYLGQLAPTPDRRLATFKQARAAYNVRSRVAHGSAREVSEDQWLESWSLLRGAALGILRSGGLPNEEALIEDLLGPVTGPVPSATTGPAARSS